MENNNYSKGFTKSSGGTNDRSIMILRKETTHQKCNGDNKRTTRVYASFFTPQCELHWTTKQGQYTIPIRDSFIHRHLLSGFLQTILNNKKATKRISPKKKLLPKKQTQYNCIYFVRKMALASDFEINN